MTTTSGRSDLAASSAALAVRRFAHDLDIRLVLEDHPETGSDEQLVIDEEHADRRSSGSRGRPGPSSGSRAATWKPPDAGPASNDPPNIATRSRMPMSPRPAPSGSATPLGPVPPHIDDAHRQRVAVVADVDRRARAVRMLQRVRERLLDDPVRRELDTGIEPPRLPLDRELHGQPRRSHGLDQGTQLVEPRHRRQCGGLGVALVRAGRGGRAAAEDTEHSPHVAQGQSTRRVDRIDRLACVRRSKLERPTRGTGLDDDDAHVMGHDVMELAGDPFAFVRDRQARLCLPIRLGASRPILDRADVGAPLA